MEGSLGRLCFNFVDESDTVESDGGCRERSSLDFGCILRDRRIWERFFGSPEEETPFSFASLSTVRGIRGVEEREEETEGKGNEST